MRLRVSHQSLFAVSVLLCVPTIGFYSIATLGNELFGGGSAIAITVRVVSVVLVTAMLFVALPARRTRMDWLLIPGIVFLALYACRLIVNIAWDGMEILPGNIQVISIFFLSTLYPAIVLGLTNQVVADRVFVRLMLALCGLFVLGLAANFDALTQAAWRLALDKVNPIALAYTASSFLIFLVLAFELKMKWLLLVAALVPVLAVVGTLALSRGMMISTIATLMLYTISRSGRERRWLMVAWLVGVLVLIANVQSDALASVVHAVSRIWDVSDMSTVGRLGAYIGSWEQFAASPIIGRYAVELSTNYYPHNIVLESAIALGVFGFLLMSVHLAFASLAGLRVLFGDNSMFLQFAALLFFRDLVGAMFSGSVWSSSGLWIFSFILVTSISRRRQETMQNFSGRELAC